MVQGQLGVMWPKMYRNPSHTLSLHPFGYGLGILGEGDSPSNAVPLTAVRANQDNLPMALSTFERDVETTFVSALVADVKLLTDLLFDHIFHPLPSSRDKAERGTYEEIPELECPVRPKHRIERDDDCQWRPLQNRGKFIFWLI